MLYPRCKAILGDVFCKDGNVCLLDFLPLREALRQEMTKEEIFGTYRGLHLKILSRLAVDRDIEHCRVL